MTDLDRAMLRIALHDKWKYAEYLDNFRAVAREVGKNSPRADWVRVSRCFRAAISVLKLSPFLSAEDDRRLAEAIGRTMGLRPISQKPVSNESPTRHLFDHTDGQGPPVEPLPYLIANAEQMLYDYEMHHRNDGVTGQFMAVKKRVDFERDVVMPAIRDVLGNPFFDKTPFTWFRELKKKGVLAWQEGQVVKLAKAIHDEDRFGDMPVLADALEDAGCDDNEIMAHAHSGNLHVKGCWVVDLILGRL